LNFGEYESLFLVVDPDGKQHNLGAAIPAETKGINGAAAGTVRNVGNAYHRIFSTYVQLPND
jgi:hypothetical protein